MTVILSNVDKADGVEVVQPIALPDFEVARFIHLALIEVFL